ncbi:MAG: YraN family protein [Deltaproteobacteria bacterium]|nr:YraN family protein [Deltaproteobacteria bacterium]
MSFYKIAFGKKGEEEAERILKKQGYKIIEKNYRCRFGEIDIIAKDGDTIAFVEVKTRVNDRFGSPKSSVDYRKQKHITNASAYYLNEKGLDDSSVRFDVVSLELGGDRFSFELIKDAFEAQE